MIGRTNAGIGVLPALRDQQVGNCRVYLTAKGEVMALSGSKTIDFTVSAPTFYISRENKSGTGSSGGNSSSGSWVEYYVSGRVYQRFTINWTEISQIKQISIAPGFYNQKKIYGYGAGQGGSAEGNAAVSNNLGWHNQLVSATRNITINNGVIS